MGSLEEFEEIDKWAKDFGVKSLEIIEGIGVDEDGELSATFVLESVIGEFADRFGTSPEEVGPVVVRRGAAECLMAMLRSHDSACVSVDGEVVVAITEPSRAGFEIV